MNPITAVLLLVCAGAVLFLPRRWACIPIIAGSTYVGLGQGVEIGPFSFTTLRLLIAAGAIRVVLFRERLPGGLIGLDRLMMLWAIWLCISSVFHEDLRGNLIEKLGNIYTALGLYFLLRIFCTSLADVVRLIKATAIVLIPVAAGMLTEQLFLRNPFAMLGSVPEAPMIRDGRTRSFGPFVHPILAGTAGGVSLPLMIGLWHRNRKTAWLGIIVCLSIVFSSGSSGPVMSALAAVAALCVWPYRRWMRALRWSAVVIYIILNIVMNVPAYYIIARLDVTGSSTGWHRAALIESSLVHLEEWWFAGTDYTRHWMPSGVSWNANHTDITNHYLQMGVIGGLPLMWLFLGSIILAFIYVGRRASLAKYLRSRDRFIIWALGAALFAHATTCISVSYFDQSVLFLYLTLAAIGSMYAEPLRETTRMRGATEETDSLNETALQDVG